jgi:hypothetical protein
MPQLSENTNLGAKGLIRRKTSLIIISIEKGWIAIMLQERRISWNAALRDIRSDRIRIARGVVSARSLIQGLLRIRRIQLVNLTGVFDRAAIMRLAVEAAKAHQLRIGAAWSVSMSVGLTAAWQAAKAARLTGLVRERANRTEEASRRAASQPLRAEMAERAVDFGGPSSSLSPSRLTHSPLRAFTQDFPGVGGIPISAPR